MFGHAGRIFLIDTDGSDIRSLSGSLEPAHAYSETAEIDFSPSISPNGDRIAFTTLRYANGGLSEHTYEIATMAMDGSDIQRLTSNTWDDVIPSWSPDGTRLAFSAAYHGELSALYSIRADGSNVQRLFKHPDIDYPEIANIHRVSWTADGSGLRFISTGYLRIDADSVRSFRGGHLADVSTGRLLDSRELPWKWGSPSHMSWSPDGYTVAVHTSEENLYQAQSEDAGIVLHTDSANGSGNGVLVRNQGNLLVAAGP